MHVGEVRVHVQTYLHAEQSHVVAMEARVVKAELAVTGATLDVI